MSKLREKRKDFINLTINEIILLILFLLLLLTAKLLKDNRDLHNTNEINKLRMMEVKKIEEMITEIKEGHGEFADAEIPEIFNELKLARDNYETSKDKDTEIAKLVEKLRVNEENLKRTTQAKDYYKKKVDNTGVGLPPCWPRKVDPTNAEYLYEAEITYNGIRLKNTDKQYPHRIQDRLNLPLSEVEEDKELSASEFSQQTERIYELSVKNECRHSLSIYDKSGNDKTHYKNMLKAIEGHFYKYEN